MKKLLSILFGTLFLLFPLSACAKETTVTTLSVCEVTHSVFYAPFYLAESLGYFKDENIEIELTNGGGADKVMSAVLSGDTDVGFCGPEAALYVTTADGTDSPKVFGQLTKRDGSFLVGRNIEAEFCWEDLEGKEILAGRKGGVPAMTFEYVLNQHGLYDGQNVTLNFDVAYNMMTSAFESGVADYCTMFQPTAYDFEQANKGYIVSSVGEESGEIPYTCFMAKESWLTTHQTVTKGFLRAITKAVKYVYEHSASEVAPLLKEHFTTDEQALYSSLVSYIEIDSWVRNMAMTEQAFNHLQDVMENADELPRRLALSEIADNTLAEEVYTEIYK